MLLGLSAAHVEQIQRARREGPFRSLDDFARRTGLSRTVIARLAKAGTFGSLRTRPPRRFVGSARARSEGIAAVRAEGGRRKGEGGASGQWSVNQESEIRNLKSLIPNP